MDVAVVDVGIGNIKSVLAALDFLGVDCRTVSDAASLDAATHVILPGVGAFDAGMRALRAAGMDKAIRVASIEQGKPLLGICLGMQLLAAYSEEGNCAGLGLVPARIERIPGTLSGQDAVKVPHVGFSAVYGFDAEGLFSHLCAEPDFYFTHSYALKDFNEPKANVARCRHGIEFVAAFQIGSLCGAQFHPEKSQTNGLSLLRNFLSMNG